MLDRFFRYIVLVAMLGLVSLALSSCDVVGGELKVQVTSRSGGSVSGVELFLTDDEAEIVSSAVTNESGGVSWSDVSTGQYNLTASRSGTFFYDQLINIEANEVTIIEIFIP